jgi:hypothetical protein
MTHDLITTTDCEVLGLPYFTSLTFMRSENEFILDSAP